MDVSLMNRSENDLKIHGTTDCHERDIVSLGARLSKDKKGGHNQSVVSRTKVNNALNAHSLDRFQTYFM